MAKVTREQIVCPYLNDALDHAEGLALSGLPGIPSDWSVRHNDNIYALTTKGGSRGEARCSGNLCNKGFGKKVEVAYNFKPIENSKDGSGRPVKVYDSDDYTESIDVGGGQCTRDSKQK